MTEQTNTVIAIVCHNCNEAMGLAEMTDGERERNEDIRIDQCDTCTNLPADPQPPTHHLAQSFELVEPNYCPNCESPPEYCRCVVCTKTGWIQRPNHEGYTCRCCSPRTPTVSVAIAVRDGILCDRCRARRADCECGA